MHYYTHHHHQRRAEIIARSVDAVICTLGLGKDGSRTMIGARCMFARPPWIEERCQ